MHQLFIAQTPCVSYNADTSASISKNPCISDSSSSTVSTAIQQTEMQQKYTTTPKLSKDTREIISPELISILAVVAILCCCCIIAGLLAALCFGKRQKKRLKIHITDSSGKNHE